MARGLSVKIEGLEQMVAGLERGWRTMPDVLTDALAGPGGEAIASAARNRVHSRTGATRGSIDVRRRGRVVEVGYDRGKEYIGTFLESGTAPHEIKPKRGSVHKALSFNGGEFARVHHPGIRAQKIMSGALRTARWEVEAAIIEEFERRGVAQP